MNYLDRLERQRVRRTDSSRIFEDYSALYEADAMASFSQIRGNTERERAQKYALQAMSPVSNRSTQISIEEGQRVQKHLQAALCETVDFRFQGSVTTNTHIVSASDIDLLVLTKKFQSNEPPLKPNNPYSNGNADLIALKKECCKILKNGFPQVHLECKNKSIRLSEGSLRRDVDVVPSNWHDTWDYKNFNNEVYRGVNILDTATMTRNQNYPFLNREKINLKDFSCQGRYKKIIRLAKTIKEDSENSKLMDFSSYDIQALFFHLDDKLFLNRDGLDLVTLGLVYLDVVLSNEDYFKKLDVIDLTRKISDKVSLEVLNCLRNEFAQLQNNIS